MPPRVPSLAAALAALLLGLLGACGLLLGALAALISGDLADACPGSGAGSIPLLGTGRGETVGATEYGGPGDPSSGVVGARGDSLLAHPDSYAELGGVTWQTADALGGLPYMTPLRISWGGRSVLAYKRDFGLGGGPVDGLPRELDLWWMLAGRLGIPYEGGQWSGAVRVERLPAGGAGALLALGQAPSPSTARGDPSCAGAGAGGVPVVPGARAQLLPGGQAAAPAGAPASVRAMLAAGNEIAGRPYGYGAGHGIPLYELSSAYDCSSSVEHLLYAAGLVPAGYTVASGELEGFGLPGPGRWVSIYASAHHVFMYVAGLRWDTHDAAGPGDGSGGIGWHPLVRDASGFVVRHPAGL